MRRNLIALAVAGLLSACTTQTPEPPAGIVCTEPRPQVCTMEYAPVCGRRTDGALGTYSSPCNACADVGVLSYRADACDSTAIQ